MDRNKSKNYLIEANKIPFCTNKTFPSKLNPILSFHSKHHLKTFLLNLIILKESSKARHSPK